MVLRHAILNGGRGGILSEKRRRSAAQAPGGTGGRVPHFPRLEPKWLEPKWLRSLSLSLALSLSLSRCDFTDFILEVSSPAAPRAFAAASHGGIVLCRVGVASSSGLPTRLQLI